MNILLAASVIINILLFVGIRNLLKQNEQLEDLIVEERDRLISRVKKAYDYMREADIRGSFESDDEVGGAFKEIKKGIEDLSKDI